MDALTGADQPVRSLPSSDVENSCVCAPIEVRGVARTSPTVTRIAVSAGGQPRGGVSKLRARRRSAKSAAHNHNCSSISGKIAAFTRVRHCRFLVGAERPFLVPSPAIRFAERAEGVKATPILMGLVDPQTSVGTERHFSGVSELRLIWRKLCRMRTISANWHGGAELWRRPQSYRRSRSSCGNGSPTSRIKLTKLSATPSSTKLPTPPAWLPAGTDRDPGYRR